MLLWHENLKIRNNGLEFTSFLNNSLETYSKSLTLIEAKRNLRSQMKGGLNIATGVTTK